MTAMDLTDREPKPQPAGLHIFEHPRQRKVVLCLLLALATLALYSPVTRAPFLNYDDAVYVTENPQVRAGLSWNTIVWAFRTPRALDWHPITWLSYALDSQMFGINPGAFHAVNILFHAANAVLLFLILESVTGLAWRSLAVAALFALHPINAESVAWIAERKNVLSMFFFLLALAAYGWYARRPGIGRYLAVTLAYVLSLMSKAQAITFPFALLLLDYWPLARITPEKQVEGERADASCGTPLWKLIAEKAPWFALSAVSAVITMRTGGAAFSYVVVNEATAVQFPLWVRLATAAIGYVKYLEKAFWPVNLAVIYPHPGFATSVPSAVASALVILGITFVVVVFRRQRFLLVGWFWFLGTLVPMIGIVTIGAHAMADRYAYIPLLGIFVMASWGAAELMERWQISAGVRAAGAVVVLLTLGIALHRQVSFWGDNATLWAHTVAITENNSTAEENLAMALISQGRAGESLPHLQRAHFLRPDDPLATINLATYEQMIGNYPAALEGYGELIRSKTTAPALLVTAWANSGYAHLSLKEYDKAREDFTAEMHIQPTNAAAYRGLGLVAQRAGDAAQAAKDYERSVELQPNPVDYLLLAEALEISGEPEAARAAQAQAMRLTQNLNDDIATVRQLLAN